jgi:lysophospholipase L1-like esterase
MKRAILILLTMLPLLFYGQRDKHRATSSFSPNFDGKCEHWWDGMNPVSYEDSVVGLIDIKSGLDVYGVQKFTNGGAQGATDWAGAVTPNTAPTGLTFYSTGKDSVKTSTGSDGWSGRYVKFWGASGSCGFSMANCVETGKMYYFSFKYRSNKQIEPVGSNGLFLKMPAYTSATPRSVKGYAIAVSTTLYFSIQSSGDVWFEIDELNVQEASINTLHLNMVNSGAYGRGSDIGRKPLKTSDGVKFDGYNDFMYNNFTDIAQPYTIYMAVRPEGVIGYEPYFDDIAASKVDLINGIRINKLAKGTTASAVQYDTYAPYNEWCFITYQVNGTSTKLWVNNYPMVTVNPSVTTAMTGIVMAALNSVDIQTPAGQPIGKFTLKFFAIRNGADNDFVRIKLTENFKKLYPAPYYQRSPTGKKIGVIGNSTIACNNTYLQPGISQLLSETGGDYAFTDISLTGNTISQQQASWLALDRQLLKTLDVVFIEIGINDFRTSANPACQTVITALQKLVDTVRYTCTPSTRIIVGTLIPFRGSMTNKPVGYDAWKCINNSIRGTSGTDSTNSAAYVAITGVDGYIDAHTTELDAGTGWLKPSYDVGDALHENRAGRDYMTNLWYNWLIANP